MTILDAKDILNLVSNAWGLSIRIGGKPIPSNGGFETGTLVGFTTLQATISSAEHHSGSYSCGIIATTDGMEATYGTLTLTSDINIPVSEISSFSIWGKGNDGQNVTCFLQDYILYTDNSKTYFGFGNVGADWYKKDLLALLDSGKTVKNIHIEAESIAQSIFIDIYSETTIR